MERPVSLLALSARSQEALGRCATSLAAFVESGREESLADLCFTLNTGRKTFEHRAVVVAGDRDEMLRALRALGAGSEAPGLVAGGGRAAKSTKIAFLFTGQGSQYAGMGRQLYETHPVFADALNRCAAIFDTKLDRRLLDLLFAPEGSSDAELLNQTGYTQPALFAFEYALAQLWQSWGVVPDVVMGHSVGEIAAMCVAGAMSLEDGLTLIMARGRLMQALPAGGGMTSIMASEDVVRQAIAGRESDVTIAAINAPNQVVISGVATTVAEIAAELAAAGVRSKALNVSHAFHSPLMKAMLAEYDTVVAGIRFSAPRTRLVSCVTAAVCWRRGHTARVLDAASHGSRPVLRKHAGPRRRGGDRLYRDRAATRPGRNGTSVRHG
jgi:myxalamid-type polyketide synthase MxaB